jgi:hypothetical protein
MKLWLAPRWSCELAVRDGRVGRDQDGVTRHDWGAGLGSALLPRAQAVSLHVRGFRRAGEVER